MADYNNPPALTQTFDRLKGRSILVVGASSGIGEAAVRLFAREGARVVAAARRSDRLAALALEMAEIGCEVEPIEIDVNDERSVSAGIDLAVAKFGRIDGAFNNAGVGGLHCKLHESSSEGFDRVVGTNLRGVFLCMKYEISAMLASGGGSIVGTSSIGGLVGGPHLSVYAASKWGLAGLTKCAALDYAREGIRVNAIAPGPTRTDMLGQWMTDDAMMAKMADSMPMNYIAEPDDMARAALWLLSDESRWTTGVVLPCEGGRSAGL